MKEIIIGAGGGIGYRVFCLALGLRMSRKLKRKLVFSWCNSPECAADFADLFEPYPGVTISDKNVQKSPSERQNKPFINYGDVIYPSKKLQDILCRNFDQKREPELIGYVRKLKPQKFLMEKVAEFSKTHFDKHTVSLHLRRTDLPAWLSKQIPNNREVIKILRAYLIKNPQSKIFLATDSPKTESLLKAAFGEKVMTYPKQEWVAKKNTQAGWARNIYRSKASLQDSLVELCLLSKANTFLRFDVFCGNFNLLASILNPKQKILILKYKKKTSLSS